MLKNQYRQVLAEWVKANNGEEPGEFLAKGRGRDVLASYPLGT